MRRAARTLFLDTGVLVADVSPRDARHEEARSIFLRIADGEWSGVYVSDFVVAEALNFVRAKIRKKEAEVALLSPIFGGPGRPPVVTEVVRVHGSRFAAALDLFHTRFDRGLSYTDCTTLEIMTEMELRTLATFDKGFRGLVDIVP